ncbi:hypothetical protein HD842_002993 [Massilia aurea]|jgi:hypothetical protein|uniref:Uncharacterized protein n=1 Tax=Massilia aurea TaxID=373040 RepID=A0A7W9X1M4_9BURK|nr:hypothetical protein [Massilia aurea]MBB6134835.1 hypothetical protein [Massilia aurea]
MIYFLRLLIIEQPFPFCPAWLIILTPARPALAGASAASWQSRDAQKYLAEIKASETKKANLSAGLTR